MSQLDKLLMEAHQETQETSQDIYADIETFETLDSLPQPTESISFPHQRTEAIIFPTLPSSQGAPYHHPDRPLPTFPTGLEEGYSPSMPGYGTANVPRNQANLDQHQKYSPPRHRDHSPRRERSPRRSSSHRSRSPRRPSSHRKHSPRRGYSPRRGRSPHRDHRRDQSRDQRRDRSPGRGHRYYSDRRSSPQRVYLDSRDRGPRRNNYGPAKNQAPIFAKHVPGLPPELAKLKSHIRLETVKPLMLHLRDEKKEEQFCFYCKIKDHSTKECTNLQKKYDVIWAYLRQHLGKSYDALHQEIYSFLYYQR